MSRGQPAGADHQHHTPRVLIGSSIPTEVCTDIAGGHPPQQTDRSARVRQREGRPSRLGDRHQGPGQLETSPPQMPARLLLPRNVRSSMDNTMSRPVKCLKGSQLIVNLSLLYLSRHPGFVRKSSSGGLPCGALGHRKISTREMRRVVVVVLVAEPCATHSQGNFLSVHGHSPIRQPRMGPAPRRPARPTGQSLAKHFRPVPSTPHTVAYRC